MLKDQQQLSAEQLTAEQQARWDSSAGSYAKVLIGGGISEPNSRQMVEAVRNFLIGKEGQPWPRAQKPASCLNASAVGLQAAS